MIKSTFAYSKNLRLLTKVHFDCVFKRVDFKASIPEFTILVRKSELENARIGFIIPKTQVKRAHERNRIKRLVKEYFRLHAAELPHCDCIIMVRKPAQLLQNDQVREKMQYLFGRLCRYYQKSS